MPATRYRVQATVHPQGWTNVTYSPLETEVDVQTPISQVIAFTRYRLCDSHEEWIVMADPNAYQANERDPSCTLGSG